MPDRIYDSFRMETLDLRQVNAFVLEKHHLTDGPATEDILKIVRDIGGLHATLSSTPYISLFLRTKNFERHSLDEVLYKKRFLGKVRYARKTVYILPKENVTIAYSAMKSLLLTRFEVYIQHLGLMENEYEECTRTILAIVKGGGKTTKEIRAELKGDLNVSAIVNLMCDQGLLIRGEPQSGWKSNIHTYYPFDEYFPDLDLNVMEESSARKRMVKQYIASYGPVSTRDISWWTGFPKREIDGILDSLKNELVSVDISGRPGPYIMKLSDVKALNSVDISQRPQVHLLPPLDPYLMGFKNRQHFLHDAHTAFIYDRSGNATNAILINGRIAGVWDWIDQKKPTIRYFLFKEYNSDTMDIFHACAIKMGHFLFDNKPKITECDSMIPLNQRTMGGFMSPLKSDKTGLKE